MPLMMTSQEYLEAYDRQLRMDAETPSAIAVERLGPLRLVTFAGKRLMHSDSTEFSRPILERARLVKVSATTPSMWRR